MDHLSCVGMSLRSRTYIYENQINLLVQLEAVSSSFDVQHVPGSRHLLELNTSSIMNTITRSTQEAEEDDKDIDWSDDKQIYEKIEKEYWDMVENQVGNNVKVEYAADLNADIYGNGFGMKSMKNLTEDQKKYVDHPWNFANFQSNKNSLLQFSN